MNDSSAWETTCPEPPGGANARLTPRSSSVARAAVWAAQRHLAAHADASADLGKLAAPREPHRLAPQVGASSQARRHVSPADTASHMGHPDGGMDVLGSPRLSLWFELATTPLMPVIGEGTSHVGVAIFVHHLGVAVVGEAVELVATVEAVSGRLVTFGCHGYAHGDMVAFGSHLRVIRDEPLDIATEGSQGGV